MLHGSDGHPRTAAHTAIPQPAGAPDGANENQDQHAADGSWSELQQQKLHKAGYFRELLASNPDINESLRSLLRPCREMVVRLSKVDRPSLALKYGRISHNTWSPPRTAWNKLGREPSA